MTTATRVTIHPVTPSAEAVKEVKDGLSSALHELEPIHQAIVDTPERLADELERFEAYSLATRPIARQLDPQLVRRICAETLLDRHRRGKPLIMPPGRLLARVAPGSLPAGPAVLVPTAGALPTPKGERT